MKFEQFRLLCTIFLCSLFKTTMTTVHRNSISKRSSAQEVDHKRHSKEPSIASTMSRLQLLNRKFNNSPSFDIELGEEDEEEGKNGNEKDADGKEINSNSTLRDSLLAIDTISKQKDIDIMSDNIETSLNLLVPLNQYMQDFESNLHKLANEMEVLQSRLSGLDDEIRKSSKMDMLLTPVLNDLLISPKCIRILLNSEINEIWAQSLTEILEKKEILQNSDSQRLNQNDVEYFLKLIDQLEWKCIERIRKFMIQNIKYLRMNNSSSIKVQQKMLKVKEINLFFQKKAPTIAKEIETAYIYTIRWYYYSNFIKYISSLEVLQIAESNTTMTSNSTKNLPVSLQLDNTNAINEYLINLPRRYEQLFDEKNKYAILAKIAETTSSLSTTTSNNNNNNNKFFFEQIFQFLNCTIIDNINIEFTFMNDFFHYENNEEINNIFKSIWSPVLKLGNNFTSYLLKKCSNDYFGILYTIHKIQNMQKDVQRLCLPELLESYFDSQLILLWPQLQRNMDILSTRVSSTLKSTALIKQVISSKNGNTLLVPLQLTQSFGTVIASLLQILDINVQGPLEGSVERISNIYEQGLVQLSEGLSDEKKKLFLYVNVQQVATVLDVSGGEGGKSLAEHYSKLAAAYSP